MGNYKMVKVFLVVDQIIYFKTSLQADNRNEQLHSLITWQWSGRGRNEPPTSTISKLTGHSRTHLYPEAKHSSWGRASPSSVPLVFFCVSTTDGRKNKTWQQNYYLPTCPEKPCQDQCYTQQLNCWTKGHLITSSNSFFSYCKFFYYHETRLLSLQLC